MRFAWALLVVVAGCRFSLPRLEVCERNDECGERDGGRCEANGSCSYFDPSCAETGQRYGENAGTNSGRCVGDEPVPDGGVDDMMAAKVCYGAQNGLVKPCFPVAITGAVLLPAAIDTSTSTLCSTNVTSTDNSTNNYCVIAGATISNESAVNVTGSKPLILVAATTITISARLDAASHNNPAKVGPGADPASCDAGTLPGANGGGAGGAMIDLGGGGGSNAAGANGGTAGGAQQNITSLRGGCPGQKGGTGNLGQGGHGGGAIYLIAEQSIVISAAINASGEGGRGGTEDAVNAGGGGGGGGGSGGMIGLDAPTIANMANGIVFANGASGGEGGSGSNAGSGTNGLEPQGAGLSGITGGTSASGGDGGPGSANGTAPPTSPNGGNGSAGANAPTGRSGGGGGGGGGVGLIKVFRGQLTGAYSPNPTP